MTEIDQLVANIKSQKTFTLSDDQMNTILLALDEKNTAFKSLSHFSQKVLGSIRGYELQREYLLSPANKWTLRLDMVDTVVDDDILDIIMHFQQTGNWG